MKTTKTLLKDVPMTEHIEQEKFEFWKEIIATALQPIPEKLRRSYMQLNLKKVLILGAIAC